MKCSKLIQILQSNDWVIFSQRGSHLKMKHPVHRNVLIVPSHGTKEVGKGLALKILKQAGILK